MEVRIKDTNGYVDADWTIENGIMVVSPKEEKFEPKDGDIVFSGVSLIAIYKESTTDTSFSAYAALNSDDIRVDFDFWTLDGIRPATEEEKQKLFAKLAEEGWEWDSEKRELVKIKWKPKEDELYYRLLLDMGRMVSHQTRWLNDIVDNSYYDKGWCFKTETECQAFCQKLNEAINQVKP